MVVCISKKAFLFISAGLETVPAILRARELGLHVVATDADSNAPGFKYTDQKLIADTYDIAQTLKVVSQFHAQLTPINGVLCVAADVPKTVSAVATALGIPGISERSAVLVSDKLAMKQQFTKDKVLIPWFCEIESLHHLTVQFNKKNFPLILKPVDSRGVRGVIRLSKDVDIAWAYQESLSHSPSKRVMVEQYLEGPQVSTESLVIDGLAHTPGFSDRNYEYLQRFRPFVIENGGELPSHLNDKQQVSVKQLIQQAAKSLGIHHGVVKGDVVMHDGQPYMIELAGRLSGGYFCSHEIPLNTGVDFVGCAIRQALGEVISMEELRPKIQKAVVQRYLFPKPGIVSGITGVDEVKNMPGIEMCEIRVKKGDEVFMMHNHPARAGVIIAIADTPTQAKMIAETAIKKISIETTLKSVFIGKDAKK